MRIENLSKKGVYDMPFATVNVTEARNRVKEIADASLEAKTALDAHRREYESRKQLVLARQEAGLTKRELQVAVKATQ